MPSYVSKLPKSLQAAWSIIVGGVHQGYSGNKILSILKAEEKGIRRQTLYDAVRAIRADIQAGVKLKEISPRVLPTARRIPEALTDIRSKYSYKFAVDIIEEKRHISRYITLSTDTWLEYPDATEIMQEYIETDHFKYGTETTVESITFVDVHKKPGVK